MLRMFTVETYVDAVSYFPYRILLDDNMAEGCDVDERVSIRQSAKSHKKYGSTSNHMKRNDIYIQHNVVPSDTLQGIALKYGVSMEQIRRANKIWANDSLFLRKTLEIPVPKTSLDAICWEEVNGSSSSNSSSGGSPYLPSSSSSSRDNCYSNSNGARRNSEPVVERDVGCSSSDQTIADILIRIDSSIAQTRNQVEKREKLQEYYSDDGLFSPRRIRSHPHHQPRMRQSLLSEQHRSSESDPPQVATVHPVVMTQGRKVQSSLQRLQKEQDEMFEL